MKPQAFLARLVAVPLVGFLPLVSSACGFLFSHAPPEGHQQMEYFTCTESTAGPIIDIVWGGLNILGAAQAAADPDAYVNSSEIIVVGLSWGVLSGSAAAVGFNKSKQCRAAKQQLAARQAQGRGAPTERQADAPVQGVVISPAADTLTVGERLQLVATAYSSGGGVIPNRMFAWSSSNDAIASVSSAGLVTAYANGSVVIAARVDNVVGTANVVVVSRP